jgi:putative FmdB family regulatory protein
MPIYEYQCAACAHQLEALQKISEAPLTECPMCHQETLTKLVSAAGFQLKGTGWYATDYSAKNKAKSDNTTASEAGSASATETKTAETPAAPSTDKASTGSS